MNGADGTKTVLRTKCSNRRCRRRYAATVDLDGGRAVAQKASSHAWLSKNLTHPLPVQDHKSERFRTPALPFTGARRRSEWSKLRRRRGSEKKQNPNSIRSYFDRGRWLRYIEDPRPRVMIGFQKFRKPITSIYRLKGQVTKNKGQVTKNKNSKRKQHRTRREARFRRTIHADVVRPRISPHHARRASTRVWSSPSLFTHIAWRGENNLHIYICHIPLQLARWD